MGGCVQRLSGRKRNAAGGRVLPAKVNQVKRTNGVRALRIDSERAAGHTWKTDGDQKWNTHTHAKHTNFVPLYTSPVLSATVSISLA